MIYRIKDWDKHYENNRTRDLQNMRWVPIPCKLDGDGYTSIILQPDGTAIYGAWIACVILAATCDPRGTLMRSGGKPHDIDSITRITRIPPDIINRMIEFVSRELDWIEAIETKEDTQDAELSHLPAALPHPHAEIPHPPALKEGRKERKEVGDKAAAIVFHFNSVPAFFTACLWFNIRQHDTVMKKPNLQKWAAEFDIMLRNDKQVTHGQILEIMGKATRDQFWHKNIKSPSSLRNQINKGTFTHFLELDAKYQTNEEIVLEAEKCAEKTEAVFNGN